MVREGERLHAARQDLWKGALRSLQQHPEQVFLLELGEHLASRFQRSSRVAGRQEASHTIRAAIKGGGQRREAPTQGFLENLTGDPSHRELFLGVGEKRSGLLLGAGGRR